MMCIAFSMCGENSESNQVPHIIFFDMAVFHLLKKPQAFASVGVIKDFLIMLLRLRITWKVAKTRT